MRGLEREDGPHLTPVFCLTGVHKDCFHMIATLIQAESGQTHDLKAVPLCVFTAIWFLLGGKTNLVV